MNRNGLKVAATGVLAMMLASCAPSLSADARKLSTEQIRAALVDATTYGYHVTWRGQPSEELFCIYHDPDGTVRGRDSGESGTYEVTGTYSIADDQICYSIPNAEAGGGCRWVVEVSTAGGNVSGASFYDPEGGLVSEAEVGGGNQLSSCLGELPVSAS